jgi:hypothetical protein
MRRRSATPFGPLRRLRVPAQVALAAAAVITNAANADVYKCAGDGGSPVYQEMPCPRGKELRNFQTNPPEITVLPGRRPGANPTATPTRGAKTNETPEKAAKSPAATGKGDPAERQHARVGMTEAEVRAKLGTPDVTSGPPNQKQMRWTWLPTEGDPDMVTTMTITDGIVTDVERRTAKK